MIEIRKSPSADSRTGGTGVTIDELRDSTEMHISDVTAGLDLIAELLKKRGRDHDHSKLDHMADFHQALVSGQIKSTAWYQMHTTEERHHLLTHVPEDVNLIDVLEHLVDCTMAGLARSGSVYDVIIPPDVLMLAVKNTVEFIKSNTTVTDSDEDILDTTVQD